MANNVGDFDQYAKKVGVFVNMAMGVRFLLCQYGKECGRIWSI
jgi:hypothetical protein